MNDSKSLRLFFIRYRESLLLFLLSTASLIGLLFFRLGSLVPGLSTDEAKSLAASTSFRLLINNPLYLPYKIVIYGLFRLHHTNIFMLRSISALFVLIMVYLFYYTLRQWYTQRTAILGTALFATSSWLLHYARLAQPDILYISFVAALAYGTWLQHTKRDSLAIIVGCLLSVFLVYIPGLIWLVVLGGWWQRKSILEHYKRHTVSGLTGITSAMALLLPLIYGLAQHPRLIRQLLGLQQTGSPKLVTVFHRIAVLPYHLFVHADVRPAIWLGNLPLLDIFALVMLVLGIYAFYFMKRLDRSKLLVGIIIVSLILIGLGVVNSIILLPVAYILVTSGIGLLLQQWFTVFPRNPLAGLIGTTLISLSVLMAVYYQINHYYIAWPSDPDTKRVFVIHP
jgi:hypothetical protein